MVSELSGLVGTLCFERPIVSMKLCKKKSALLDAGKPIKGFHNATKLSDKLCRAFYQAHSGLPPKALSRVQLSKREFI